METATINFRVADFLKKYPPFHAMQDTDLLDLAGRGRVKFFERNEYIVLQGEPYRHYVFVIQQGTVTLWDESRETVALRDVLGAGDFLGIEQFNDGRSYSYSARSSSDVVVYTFPAIDFEALVLKYPHARQYVRAYGSVTADYQPREEQLDLPNTFLHDLVKGGQLPVCDIRASIGDVARYMLKTGAEAVAVIDTENRARGLLTADVLLEWIGKGAGDARQSVATIIPDEFVTIPANATLTDGALAMSTAGAGALAITDDGTARGQLLAVVTPRDLVPIFGDHPIAILREIQQAPDIHSLRRLNQRTRVFVFRYLTGSGSVEWLARFISLADSAILKRTVTLTVPDELPICWCFCGPAGRGELLTNSAPQIVLILDNDCDHSLVHDVYRRVTEATATCGYLPAGDLPFDPSFYAATVTEWEKRYRDWLRDPILQQTQKASAVFDLKPIHGRLSLWQAIEKAVAGALDRDFLYVLANDCLSSLPPLTFFQDAVVDESGEHSAVFRLEHTALRPLVDVGRVFGMAGRAVLGTSTLERFVIARTLLPERAPIFAEASDTLRAVLWQQGRIGIGQNTGGAELPPALLSRYDRQILKSGFRSILRLLEFMADPQWLKTL